MPARLRTAIVVLAAGLLLAVPIAGAQAAPRATAAQQAANEKLGRQLVTRFWELLKAQDRDGLRVFLSPAFQLQRANGTGANRNQYIPAIGTSIIVLDYALSDFKVTRSGDVLVARFTAVATEEVGGQPYARPATPRLATFFFNGSAWRMTSNANFNAPAN